ncbi:MAG: hypothetical protein H7A25_02650 [Leptospiraceae bacterium]|nr:hypothetical protein [Leptospiraceae bacterium]
MLKKFLLTIFINFSLWSYTPGKWSHLDSVIMKKTDAKPKKEVVKSPSDKVLYSAEFEYDKDGNLIKEKYLNSTGKEDGYTRYSYRGKMVIKEELFGLDGKIKETRIFEYDKNDNLKRLRLLDSSGIDTVHYKIKEVMNNELQSIEVLWLGSKDMEYYNVKRSPDSEFKFIQEISLENRKTMGQVIYMYDKNKKLISRMNSVSDDRKQNNIKYDQEGRVQSFTFHVKRGGKWELLKTHEILY